MVFSSTAVQRKKGRFNISRSERKDRSGQVRTVYVAEVNRGETGST